MRHSQAAARLAAALTALEALDLDGLRARWRALVGRAAPATFRTPLLRAAIAYALQERTLGGLKPRTRRVLQRVAEAAEDPGGSSADGASLTRCLPPNGPETAGEGAAVPVPAVGRRSPATPIRVKPGTRLLRTWQGVTHEVLVGDTGVSYRGTQYRSLSEVARHITGQRWSGPMFFGLRRRAGRHAA